MTSLRVVERLLRADGATASERAARQQLCNEMGASTLVLKFASCKDDALCDAGLQMGKALLLGGNTAVQASLLQLMRTNDLAAAPADGSDGTFLSSMKRRIRIGIKELKERKTFLAQQQERRATFEEMTMGMSARAKAMVLEDQERPFATTVQIRDPNDGCPKPCPHRSGGKGWGGGVGAAASLCCAALYCVRVRPFTHPLARKDPPLSRSQGFPALSLARKPRSPACDRHSSTMCLSCFACFARATTWICRTAA